jgi:hypothetical protein
LTLGIDTATGILRKDEFFGWRVSVPPTSFFKCLWVKQRRSFVQRSPEIAHFDRFRTLASTDLKFLEKRVRCILRGTQELLPCGPKYRVSGACALCFRDLIIALSAVRTVLEADRGPQVFAVSRDITKQPLPRHNAMAPKNTAHASKFFDAFADFEIITSAQSRDITLRDQHVQYFGAIFEALRNGSAQTEVIRQDGAAWLAVNLSGKQVFLQTLAKIFPQDRRSDNAQSVRSEAHQRALLNLASFQEEAVEKSDAHRWLVYLGEDY